MGLSEPAIEGMSTRTSTPRRRAECLDHVLIRGEDHLEPVLRRYCAYFNYARPHQGIGQKIPSGPPEPPVVGGTVQETPILGGLHHDYRLAA